MSVIAMGISGGGLSNGSLINDVAHFVTDTKPTTRPDSSALVTGDHWYNTTDGTEWFWNGTYWLSVQKYTNSFAYYGSLANSNSYVGLEDMGIPSNQAFVIEEIYLKWRYSGYTPTNYWNVRASVQLSLGESPPSINPPNYTTTAAEGAYSETLNLYVANTTGTMGVRCGVEKMGIPGNITELTATIIWRYAA